MARGGKKKGTKNRDAQALMDEIGVDKRWTQDPLEFLMTVMNADIKTLNSMIKGGDSDEMVYIPSMGQRIEAARHAAPYLHQKLPTVVDQNVTHSWADEMRQAEERLSKMRVKPDDDQCTTDAIIH